MAKYRKRPIVIEAFQMDRDAIGDTKTWPDWAQAAWDAKIGTGAIWRPVYDTMMIDTLEGTMRVDEDDWIIRGIKGELYPCKPDIFDATYDLVDESEATDGDKD